MDRLPHDDLLDEYRFPSKKVNRLLDRFLAVGEDLDNLPPLDEDIIPNVINLSVNPRLSCTCGLYWRDKTYELHTC